MERGQELSARAFDVAVVGAGPAGAATALALRRHDPSLSVALIAPTPRRVAIGETLHPSARPLLERLGVWGAFSALGSAPCIATLSAWETHEARANDHFIGLHGEGWFIDRVRFDALLVNAAAEARATPIPATVRAVERQGNHIRLTLDHDHIDARFVIDATGRRARVATALGAERVRDDHLVATSWVCERLGRDARTVIEAAPSGWWYTAPVATGAVVTLCSDADIAGPQHHRDPIEFDALLAATMHIRTRVGARVDGPHVWPADSSASAPWARPGWLTVGDAAIAYDPLSGQGLQKALRHALIAAYAASDALHGRGDWAARYAEVLGAEWAGYRFARERAYAPSRRFGTPFWRRRPTRLTLPPTARLTRGPGVARPLHLPPSALAQLIVLAEGRAVHEVVREAHALGLGDRAVILALQHLRDVGALLQIASPLALNDGM